MSLRARQLARDRAARACARSHAEAMVAWSQFKDDTGRAATPARIVGAGLIAGLVSGLAAPTGNYAAPLGEKLFRVLLDSAFGNLGAAFAAGLAATGDSPAAESAAKSNDLGVVRSQDAG